MRRAYPWIVVVATLAAFAGAAGNEFVEWDDPFNLHRNPRFNPPTADGLLHYWANAAHGLYVPLTYTVWWALAHAQVPPDPQGVTLNPWLYHGTSVLLHAASALVAYRLLERLVRPAWAAMLGALLFALHPVQTEPVAWASGTKDVLAGLLVLLAVWQYVECARSPANARTQGGSKGGERSGDAATKALDSAPGVAGSSRDGTGLDARAHYVLALVALVGAMLAKPSAVVAPLIAFAIDYWLLRRPMRRILVALAPWAVLALACALVARLAQQVSGFEPPPPWLRPLVAGDALAFYLWKLAWPIELALDYGRTPARVRESGAIWFTWIVPAALAAAMIALRRRAPELLAGGVIFVSGVAPVLGLAVFQFQGYSTVADHYLYVALLGPALGAAWAAAQLAERFGRAPVIAIAAIVLALLAARTALQARVWRDDESLFRNATSVNPRSYAGHYNLGLALQRRSDLEPAERAALLAEAERMYARAIELKPEDWRARAQLAQALSSRGEREAAIAQGAEALRLVLAQGADVQRVAVPPIARRLGADLARAGRREEAQRAYELALRFDPQDAESAAALARLRQDAPSPGRAPSR